MPTALKSNIDKLVFFQTTLFLIAHHLQRNKNENGEREKLLDKTVQVKANAGGASYGKYTS